MVKCREIKDDKLADQLLMKKDEVVDFVTKAGLTIKDMTEEHTWFERNGYLLYAAQNEDGKNIGWCILIFPDDCI